MNTTKVIFTRRDANINPNIDLSDFKYAVFVLEIMKDYTDFYRGLSGF